MVLKKISSFIALFLIMISLSGLFSGTTVLAEQPQYKWVFMVYMDADNNLEGAGISDFNEMEMVDQLVMLQLLL